VVFEIWRRLIDDMRSACCRVRPGIRPKPFRVAALEFVGAFADAAQIGPKSAEGNRQQPAQKPNL
jgi:hypothetical protein